MLNYSLTKFRFCVLQMRCLPINSEILNTVLAERLHLGDAVSFHLLALWLPAECLERVLLRDVLPGCLAELRQAVGLLGLTSLRGRAAT